MNPRPRSRATRASAAVLSATLSVPLVLSFSLPAHADEGEDAPATPVTEEVVEEAAAVEEVPAVEEAPVVEEVLAAEEAPVVEEAPAAPTAPETPTAGVTEELADGTAEEPAPGAAEDSTGDAEDSTKEDPTEEAPTEEEPSIGAPTENASPALEDEESAVPTALGQAVDDSVVVRSGSSVVFNVWANDEVEGGAVVRIERQGEFGTAVVLANSTVEYTARSGLDEEADTVTYALLDKFGSVLGTADINVSILAEEEGSPVAQDDEVGARAGEDTVIDILDNDTHEGPVNFELFAAPRSIAFYGDGKLEYQGSPTESGTITFSYTITDSSGRSDTANVTLRVNPVAVTDTDLFAYHTEESWFEVLYNDLGDLDPSSLEIVAQPLYGSIRLEDGIVFYSGRGELERDVTDRFSYRVADRSGNFSEVVWAEVYLAREWIEDERNYSATVAAGRTARVDVINDEYEGGWAGVEIQPEHGVAYTDDQGIAYYTPDEGFVGTDSFIYVGFSDNVSGRYVRGRVTITVEAPVSAVPVSNVGNPLGVNPVRSSVLSAGSTYSNPTRVTRLPETGSSSAPLLGVGLLLLGAGEALRRVGRRGRA